MLTAEHSLTVLVHHHDVHTWHALVQEHLRGEGLELSYDSLLRLVECAQEHGESVVGCFPQVMLEGQRIYRI